MHRVCTTQVCVLFQLSCQLALKKNIFSIFLVKKSLPLLASYVFSHPLCCSVLFLSHSCLPTLYLSHFSLTFSLKLSHSYLQHLRRSQFLSSILTLFVTSLPSPISSLPLALSLSSDHTLFTSPVSLKFSLPLLSLSHLSSDPPRLTKSRSSILFFLYL